MKRPARLLLAAALLAVVSSATAAGALAIALSALSAEKEKHTELLEQRSALAGRVAQLSVSAQDTSLPEELVWRTDGAAPVQEIQSAVLAAARSAGLAVTSFGQAPPRQAGSPESVVILIEADGDIRSLGRFLAGTARSRPPLALGDLSIRRSRGSDTGAEGPIISIRAEVRGFVGAPR